MCCGVARATQNLRPLVRALLNECMEQVLCRLLVRAAISLGVSVTAVAACTHTTDRIVEPSGSGDASTSPELADAGGTPIGPIAHPPEPAEDFRLVRGNEFGAPLLARASDENRDLISLGNKPRRGSGLGGFGGDSGSGGMAGGDTRPVVACGGAAH